jgi:predicted DNA-binding protein (MmcQ/YjbR family)
MSPMSDAAKRHLIELCRALPGATEDIKWGKDLIFSVGEKMFAGFDTDESRSITLKVDPAVFPILAQTPGITPAPYLARAFWVRMETPDVLPVEQIEALLRESHQLVAAKLTKKLRAKLGIPE